MTDDLSDVMAILRAKRGEHLRAVAVLDQAIDALLKLPGTGDAVAEQPPPTEQSAGRSTGRVSVLQAILDLANEAPRSWTAEGIVTEYERRGTPLDAKNPMNSVFSALSRASKKGMLDRVGHGQYRSPKFGGLAGLTVTFGDRTPTGAAFDDEQEAVTVTS